MFSARYISKCIQYKKQIEELIQSARCSRANGICPEILSGPGTLSIISRQ